MKSRQVVLMHDNPTIFNAWKSDIVLSKWTTIFMNFRNFMRNHSCLFIHYKLSIYAILNSISNVFQCHIDMQYWFNQIHTNLTKIKIMWHTRYMNDAKRILEAFLTQTCCYVDWFIPRRTARGCRLIIDAPKCQCHGIVEWCSQPSVVE